LFAARAAGFLEDFFAEDFFTDACFSGFFAAVLSSAA
jgi:hypothetical protein